MLVPPKARGAENCATHTVRPSECIVDQFAGGIRDRERHIFWSFFCRVIHVVDCAVWMHLRPLTVRRLLGGVLRQAPPRFSSFSRRSMSAAAEDKKSELSSGRATRFSPASRLAKFVEPTVWHEFTPLAAKSKAVNLVG